jgi:hypothetical protein
MTLHCPKNFFYFFFINKSLILPADQKKKDWEKDIGRVEMILPAVDQKEERLWERYWKSGNDGGGKFKDKESSF